MRSLYKFQGGWLRVEGSSQGSSAPPRPSTVVIGSFGFKEGCCASLLSKGCSELPFILVRTQVQDRLCQNCRGVAFPASSFVIRIIVYKV